VDIPGFATPRKYDFLIFDPKTSTFIGKEVKTTLYATIRLNPNQVAKDVAVVTNGGFAPQFGVNVTAVGYLTYCFACDIFNLRSYYLSGVLSSAGINVSKNYLPGIGTKM